MLLRAEAANTEDAAGAGEVSEEAQGGAPGEAGEVYEEGDGARHDEAQGGDAQSARQTSSCAKITRRFSEKF